MKLSEFTAVIRRQRIRAVVLRQAVPFLAGVLGGLFLVGPVLAAVLIALHTGHKLDLIPLGSAASIPLEGCDYVFLPRLTHAVDAGAIFLSGSSELQTRGRSPFSTLRVGDRALIPVGDKGPGIGRGALLIERLRSYGRRPPGIIVILNTHYATTANKKMDPVGALFFDADSSRLHKGETEADSPRLDSMDALFARLRMIQRCATAESIAFDRALTSPFSMGQAVTEAPVHGEIDPGWGVPVEMIPHPSQVAGVREQRRVSRRLVETEFGRTAAHLRSKAENSHVPIRVLVIPFHPLFTEKLGLDPQQEEASLLLQTREILGPSIVVVELPELRNARLFHDPIHLTAEGRDILARIIVREAASFP